MKEKGTAFRLFEDFDSVDKKAWLGKVKEDLQGKPFEKLLWQTDAGFVAAPYYDQADLEGLSYLEDFHNATLATGQEGQNPRHWLNTEMIAVVTEKKANELALEALNMGAEGIIFNLQGMQEVPDLEILLKEVFPQYCAISFILGEKPDGLIQNYFDYLQKKQINFHQIQGCLMHDPLGKMVQEGNLPEQAYEPMVTLLKNKAKAAGFKLISLDLCQFHDAGASASEEIGLGLNAAVEYLDQLEKQEIPARDFFENLCLRVAVGSHYFMEIAKLRALRILFFKLAQLYGLQDFQPGSLPIYAFSSLKGKTPQDVQVNMLRNTTEAMAAILGGCNALTIVPHDAHVPKQSPFSTRLARNVSNILKEEAYLDKVADPAAGSYYIESLVDLIIQQSWQVFQKIEEKGELKEALAAGFIQAKILASIQKDAEG